MKIRLIRVIRGPKKQNVMKESTKKTIKRIGEIIITILTALLTTLGAHAAGIVQ